MPTPEEEQQAAEADEATRERIEQSEKDRARRQGQVRPSKRED